MHVVVVSMGPVQEFIASARKCRDLWFGSWLLSELCRASARSIAQSEGKPEAEVLVFPGAKTDDDSRSVANKIVARVEGEPRELMRAAEAAMAERLREIREAAFARVGRGHPQREELFQVETARLQVDDLIEFLWASIPEESSYAEARAEAERLLAAVKASRGWKQPPWAQAGVVKSSLDGVRESVLHEALYDNPRATSGGKLAKGVVQGARRRREFGVHGAERLCGVGLLKRFGNRDKRGASTDANPRPERIFSTSHVASAPFRQGLRQIDAAAQWARFLGELDASDGSGESPEVKRGGAGITGALNTVPEDDELTGKIDGSVFYEGRLLEEIEEHAGSGRDAQEQGEKAVAALRRFLRSVPELGEPNPNFALLLADGDHMGAAIDACGSFAEHRELSRKLEKFASGVGAIVQRHGGSLVYAGGDDVLALLPLHQLRACIAVLTEEFRQAMARWSVEVDGVTRSPTLSAGVAIVHHLVPLELSLTLVREAEKRAKAVAGKNALAVVVKPRSGGAVEIDGSLGSAGGEEVPLLQRLEYLVGLHRDDRVPTRAQYELMDLATRTATDVPEELRPTLESVAVAEAERILIRKRPGHGEESGLEPEVLARLRRSLLRDPARLGRELYVAGELARAEAQAAPPPQLAPAEVSS